MKTACVTDPRRRIHILMYHNKQAYNNNPRPRCTRELRLPCPMTPERTTLTSLRSPQQPFRQHTKLKGIQVDTFNINLEHRQQCLLNMFHYHAKSLNSHQSRPKPERVNTSREQASFSPPPWTSGGSLRDSTLPRDRCSRRVNGVTTPLEWEEYDTNNHPRHSLTPSRGAAPYRRELTDMPEDDLEWDSDMPDSDDEDDSQTAQAATAAAGAKIPKRAAGHGSQRVANKAKKSDVKKRWRELDWGKKPKWLSWRAAVAYIQRGEKPPAKEPLPPTPSPQRTHNDPHDILNMLIYDLKNHNHRERPALLDDNTLGGSYLTALHFNFEEMALQIIQYRSSTTDHFMHKQTRGITPPATRTTNQFHNFVGDVLVVQPAHLTDDPPTTENPFPDLADLAQQADEAIASGRAPAWQIDGEGPSMRSSVRVDDNSHHLSWVQGVTPATLPPPMPLHQGECHWVMAWNNMVTTNNAIVRHPARQNIEPTIVIYKTLAGQPSRGVLPDHAQLTIHPAGAKKVTGIRGSQTAYAATTEGSYNYPKKQPDTTGRYLTAAAALFVVYWQHCAYCPQGPPPKPGTQNSRPANPATVSKAKPPPPPTTSSGSETETSWPSEDPPRGEGDGSTMLQTSGTSSTVSTTTMAISDVTFLMQRGGTGPADGGAVHARLHMHLGRKLQAASSGAFNENEVPPMIRRIGVVVGLSRTTAGAAAIDGKALLVVGGAPSFSTVEVYRVPTADAGFSAREEEKVADLSDGRMGCQAAVLALPSPGKTYPVVERRCVVVIGGERCDEDVAEFARIRQLAGVPVFDTEMGHWRKDDVVPPLADWLAFA
ncbi:hypothetical protein AK812_SmicGene27094 [Symbiodinium microadriaticum]|uniref:Uncharacterized protein n=1 Tax=Symbiodinium microadriaticum TaxID=2951 RepID=A0A1Q9D7V4_SYMMI|nr:hypothetical protein AK812_SmicGene27094 [Symbiodinium microadriaticum]CAE7939355.1 unnamed protein product [Symbiodinium sp. KB8]